MESVKSTLATVTSTVQNAIGSGTTQEDTATSHHGNVQHDSAVPTHGQGSAVHHNETTTATSHTDTATTATSHSDTATTVSSPADVPSRTIDAGAHDGIKGASGGGAGPGLSNELEKTLSGSKDPAVQGEEHPKMTGEGAPGSHSALFGLTPDGKKA